MTTKLASPPRRRRTALALLTAKAALGASLALGLMLSPHSTAHVYAAPAGQCQEDMPCWSCVDMGDKVCGPGNSNGAPAGRYDEGGVLVDPWPVGDEPVGYWANDGWHDESTAYRLGTGPLADWGDDNGYDAGYEN